jgi:hypothetical protein
VPEPDDPRTRDEPFPPPELTLWQKIRLLWGRPRRFFLGVFRPGYVRAMRARRRGECRRCGACCQLAVRCRHLVYEGGLAACDKYDGERPLNCRNFPIDPRCLADRDLNAPDLPCGFYFVSEDDEGSAGAAGAP